MSIEFCVSLSWLLLLESLAFLLVFFYPFAVSHLPRNVIEALPLLSAFQSAMSLWIPAICGGDLTLNMARPRNSWL